MSNCLALTFTALAEHIDMNGHVNNTVWLRWMEELSGAHWQADARPEDVDRYVWLVLRHEIDYRANVGEGAQVTGTTEIRERPRAWKDRLRQGPEHVGPGTRRAATRRAPPLAKRRPVFCFGMNSRIGIRIPRSPCRRGSVR